MDHQWMQEIGMLVEKQVHNYNPKLILNYCYWEKCMRKVENDEFTFRGKSDLLTRIPSNLDRARSGLSARKVLRDFMAVKSE